MKKGVAITLGVLGSIFGLIVLVGIVGYVMKKVNGAKNGNGSSNGESAGDEAGSKSPFDF